MAYPVAVGQTSWTGIVIPEVWGAKYQEKFYPRTCLSEITNTDDVNGEITKCGDTVHINILPDMDTFDYTLGMKLPVSNPSPSMITFLVDKGVGFNFVEQPLNVKQAKIAYIEKFTEDAVKQTKIGIERGVFAGVYSSAHAQNKGATGGIDANLNFGVAGAPVVITADNVLRKFLECDQAMDELNIPEDERFKIIPPWMATMLKDSDLKNASLMGNGQSLLVKGVIGAINNAMIIRSNLLPRVTDSSLAKCTHVICGHKSAIAFATQLVVNEEVPNKDDYGKLRRGLTVYGYKVVRPAGLVDLYCTQG